jgi:hypothetical protein
LRNTSGLTGSILKLVWNPKPDFLFFVKKNLTLVL